MPNESECMPLGQNEYQHRIEALDAQVMMLSQRANLTEITASVLHNIGNVLNSVKVSMGLIDENQFQQDVARFSTVVQLMKQHQADLVVFLSTDKKGQLIPAYLFELAAILNAGVNKLSLEMANLKEHITHIEDIVAMQQVLGGTSSGRNEKMLVTDAIESALKMCDVSFGKHTIDINRQYQNDCYVVTDKCKVLQILLNLIQNAKDALSMHDTVNNQRTITIKVAVNPATQTVDIAVTDNGHGISAEDLNKIFSFGFTTKPTGHGFGLHRSLISARELGGELSISSEGKGKGACFTLRLPISPEGM